MKKLILSFLAAILLLGTVPSYAWNRSGNGYHGGHSGYHGGHSGYRGGYNNNWIAPAIGGLIIGGVVGSALAQPYYTPAPVYVQPAPVYVQPSYAPPPPPPYGFHYEQILDSNCNCYVTVLVSN